MTINDNKDINNEAAQLLTAYSICEGLKFASSMDNIFSPMILTWRVH